MIDAINHILGKANECVTVGEAKQLKEYFMEKPEKVDARNWAKGIKRTTEILLKKKGFMEADKFWKEAYKSFKHNYSTNYGLLADLVDSMLMANIQEKKHDEALKLMQQYIYNLLAQIKFGYSMRKVRLFCFRSCTDYSFNDIEKDTISLAHPREFNDPLDTLLVRWIEDSIREQDLKDECRAYLLLMKKVVEHIKLRCFIRSEGMSARKKTKLGVANLNVLMWAHYANSHKGFCIEYEFDLDFLSNNFKADEKLLFIQPIEYKDSLKLDKTFSMKTALFEKGYFWKYENEMRMCLFDIENEL